MADRVGGEANLKERVLQIAIFSGDQSLGGIKAGLKAFPVNKLIILFETEPKGKFDVIPQTLSVFARQLKEALDLEVEVVPIFSNGIDEVLSAVKAIHDNNSKNFTETVMNLTSGGKILACTSLSSAFFFGIRAFYVDQSGSHIMPILKLGYNHVLSDTKMSILKAIGRAGGTVESLESLTERTRLEKSLISRHINGAEDSRGLTELGLVEVSKEERGRVKVRLTTLGQIMLLDVESS